MANKIECLINNYWPLYYGFKAMPVSLIDKVDAKALLSKTQQALAR